MELAFKEVTFILFLLITISSLAIALVLNIKNLCNSFNQNKLDIDHQRKIYNEQLEACEKTSILKVNR